MNRRDLIGAALASLAGACASSQQLSQQTLRPHLRIDGSRVQDGGNIFHMMIGVLANHNFSSRQPVDFLYFDNFREHMRGELTYSDWYIRFDRNGLSHTRFSKTDINYFEWWYNVKFLPTLQQRIPQYIVGMREDGHIQLYNKPPEYAGLV